MAENPTNQRTVKFWTSDFGSAVAMMVDGWIVGCGRCWLTRPRPPPTMVGRPRGDWPFHPHSLRLSGNQQRLTPRITSLIHRRLATTGTATTKEEEEEEEEESEKMLMCIFGA